MRTQHLSWHLVCSECLPERREERKQAFGLSSGLCASAAPDASASPSPAPGGAGWPAAFASPGIPEIHRQTREPGATVSFNTCWFRALFNDLFLLPHDLQFLRKLDLPLPLCFLRSTTQLLPVFIPQGVEGRPSIAHLSQLILQPLIVHWQQQTGSYN